MNEKIGKKLIGIGISPKRIFIFPIFIDPSDYTFKNLVQPCEQKEESKNIILFVGSLIKIKGIDILLYAIPEVIRIFPNTIFYIIGEGAERNNLEKIITKIDISNNVVLTGNLGLDKLLCYYKISNFLILPSRSEAWGRVVIESLFNSKPVIVSDSCAISDFIVQSHCGLSFPDGNHQILAQKIIELLNDKGRQEKMGQSGKDLVIERFGISTILPKYQQLWVDTIRLFHEAQE